MFVLAHGPSCAGVGPVTPMACVDWLKNWPIKGRKYLGPSLVRSRPIRTQMNLIGRLSTNQDAGNRNGPDWPSDAQSKPPMEAVRDWPSR